MSDQALPASLDDSSHEEETIQPPLHAVEDVLHEIAHAPKVPAILRSRNARDQIRHAFDLIGGIPRLAHWAHLNPGDFYKIWARTVPTQVTGADGGPIQVQVSWVNGRDTSGRHQPPTIIDVPFQESSP
jgi:hypothetical protein